MPTAANNTNQNQFGQLQFNDWSEVGDMFGPDVVAALQKQNIPLNQVGSTIGSLGIAQQVGAGQQFGAANPQFVSSGFTLADAINGIGAGSGGMQGAMSGDPTKNPNYDTELIGAKALDAVGLNPSHSVTVNATPAGTPSSSQFAQSGVSSVSGPQQVALPSSYNPQTPLGSVFTKMPMTKPSGANYTVTPTGQPTGAQFSPGTAYASPPPVVAYPSGGTLPQTPSSLPPPPAAPAGAIAGSPFNVRHMARGGPVDRRALQMTQPNGPGGSLLGALPAHIPAPHPMAGPQNISALTANIPQPQGGIQMGYVAPSGQSPPQVPAPPPPQFMPSAGAYAQQFAPGGPMQPAPSNQSADLRQSALGQRLTPFASGGAVRDTDTVPAMLTPGEYVINRDAVQRIGERRLDQINDGRVHMQDGGMVDPGMADFSITPIGSADFDPGYSAITDPTYAQIGDNTPSWPASPYGPTYDANAPQAPDTVPHPNAITGSFHDHPTQPENIYRNPLTDASSPLFRAMNPNQVGPPTPQPNAATGVNMNPVAAANQANGQVGPPTPATNQQTGVNTNQISTVAAAAADHAINKVAAQNPNLQKLRDLQALIAKGSQAAQQSLQQRQPIRAVQNEIPSPEDFRQNNNQTQLNAQRYV